MGQVRLILREDVTRLGHAGDVVEVKPGYARNYLLPQGKAMLATRSNVNELEHHKRVVAEQVARDRSALEALRDRIESLQLEVSAQAGEEGKLFGSVTALQIAELLAEKGVEIDRRKIAPTEPIKELGEHLVPIRLNHEVTAQVKVVVAAAE